MLIVKMWRNTQDIRAVLVGNTGSTASNSEGNVTQDVSSKNVTQNKTFSNAGHLDPSATNPISPVANPAYANAEDSSWTCASCGTINRAGVFCSQCGKRRN